METKCTFDTKESLECMNKELDEVFSILSYLSDIGMFELVELAFPRNTALPDTSVISVLKKSRHIFKSLSALCSTLKDQLDILLDVKLMLNN